MTLGQALPLPQCPNLFLQRDVTVHALLPDAAAGGGGTAVDEGWGQGALGCEEMFPQSPGSAFGHRVPPGTAGLSEGKHCSEETLSPGGSSHPGPCPSESLVACNPREHPRTCSPPTSPAMGLPVPAVRTVMLGHPATIPCPALLSTCCPCTQQIPASRSLLPDWLAGTGIWRGPLVPRPWGAPDSVSCAGWEQRPGCGRKGALLDRETEA